MSFALPVHLTTALSDREAIADAISRCVCGLDTADRALFCSAFTPDAVFDLNGALLRGIDAICASCYDVVSRLDTTHLVSNVRAVVAADGRSATATATGLAHHYPAGRGLAMEDGGNTPRLVVGSLYSIELVKVEEENGEGGQGTLWKATLWKLKSVWSQGDWKVMEGLPEQQLTKDGL